MDSRTRHPTGDRLTRSTPGSFDERRVIIIDALAEEGFHLCRDDLFLVGALAGAFDGVRIHSSPASLSGIRAAGVMGVDARPTVMQSPKARRRFSGRIRAVVRTLAVRGLRRGEQVVFQSFYELAVILFSLVNPSARLYLLVTNNLTSVNQPGVRARMKRRLLGASMARATRVVVYTRFAAEELRRVFPRIPPERVRVMRFHQAGIVRDVRSFDDRRQHISYIGWAREGKGLDQFLALVARDRYGAFTYGLYGTFHLSDHHRAVIQQAGDRIELVSGYIPDDQYIEFFNQSMFIALPYGEAYAGSLSGVFCDAISTGTPVIASRIEPFTEYFETFGPLGHLVDFDDATILDAVSAAPTREEYAVLQRNLLSAREAHEPGSIRRAFARVLAEERQVLP